MTTRIASTFAELKSAGQMAFMPFITSGDPNMETTLALIRELAAQKVDLIEVGFPYSDPIADGPVIQASYTRALENGLEINDIFSGLETLAGEEIPPLVAMVAFSIIFRIGPETFVEKAKQAGFSGLIVPDLPGDEAAEFFQLVKSAGLDLIQLVAPTTPDDRVERILTSASGFVYCISTAGTTGVRDQLPEELKGQLDRLRNMTDLPLAVGFGIGRPDQVDMLRGAADGVIVGSAIVRHLQSCDNESSASAAIKAVGEFSAGMVAATHAT